MDLLASPDFWFGLVILLVHQGSKFAELDAIGPGDRHPDARSLSELRASDFVRRQTYATALLVYLALVAVVFFVTCLIPLPTMEGLAGIFSIEGLAEDAAGLAWPLYIAAAYMGLSQSGIPLFSAIVQAQRRAVHWLIGIPRTVVDSSVSFATRLLAETPDEAARDLLRRLASDAWIARIDAYADAVYYRNELDRLGLSSPEGLAEALNGSRREAARAVRALVFSAALATSREGGTRALRRLAADLGVPDEAVVRPPPVVGPFLLVTLVTVALLWVLMPLAGQDRDPHQTFWPVGYEQAGMFIVGMFSVFLAVGFTFWLRPAPTLKDVSQPNIWHVGWVVLERCWGVLLAVLLFDVAFGFLLLLTEAGQEGPRFPADIAAYYAREGAASGRPEGFGWDYITSYLPFTLLHAVIVVVTCYAVLIWGYVVANGLRLGSLPRHALVLAVFVAGVSMLYASTRVRNAFHEPELADHLDYILLIAFLRVVAALLGLLAANLYYRRGSPAPQARAAVGPAPAAGSAVVSPLRAAPPPASAGR